MSKFHDWEREITDKIIEELNIPNGDAQGVVEARSFEMMQGWSAGSSPKEMVEKIKSFTTFKEDMNSSYEDKPDSIENKERFKGPKKKFN